MDINSLPQPSFEAIARALGEKDILNLRLQMLVEQLQARIAELEQRPPEPNS